MPHKDYESYRQYQREYQRKRAAEWRHFAVQSLGGKCVICGSTINLEVHHKNPQNKEFNISQIWSRNESIKTKELAKCEVRCNLHHKEAHAAKCGTESAWKNGCRCDICVEAKRSYNRAWMSEWRKNGKDKSRNNFKGR